MKKIFILQDINDIVIEKFKLELTILFSIVTNNDEASDYEYEQFIIDSSLKKRTLFIDNLYNIYSINILLIPKKYHKYFLVWNINSINILRNIEYFFNNLEWVFLHNLSVFSSKVQINKDIFQIKYKISTKLFLNGWYDNEQKACIINDILTPEELIVSNWLYKLYQVLSKKLQHLNNGNYLNNIYFDDFILSLVPEKYWINSLFFLNSKLLLKISTYFQEYDEIISLHIPVARSKYLKDLFESLLQQTNQKFKIFIWVDGYNERQKDSIVKILNKYKNRFEIFDYFVNSKNLWVWKTRRKLINWDKKSRYVVFLDDDNFLSTNTINFLYEKIEQYPNMWMYCISNVDVRFDINYKDYINNKWPFDQPRVYTNRERVNRLPLYCSQEETPLTHDRFYSDLMDIKYNKVFDNCSIDMVFNRFLEILCWNINLKWAYQFMRIWHQFHQTREDWFELKEFQYVMYILKTIADLNNNNYYYTYLIKTLVPKQNTLFT